jgi:hypothetical protein
MLLLLNPLPVKLIVSGSYKANFLIWLEFHQVFPVRKPNCLGVLFHYCKLEDETNFLNFLQEYKLKGNLYILP